MGRNKAKAQRVELPPDPNAPPPEAHRVLDSMGTPPRNQTQRRATFKRRARLHRRLLKIEERAKALGLVADHE